jgi:hypothetical protein
MDLRTYELLMQRIEDARRLYYSGKSKLEHLRDAAADTAIAGHGITEITRRDIEDAKSDMRIGEELFVDAKQQMIKRIASISL